MTAALAAGETGTWDGRALGVDVRVVVTKLEGLDEARQILVGDVAALDLACSRFRPDSEIAAVDRARGRPVVISPLLADAIAVAIDAAAATAGDLDPTLGGVVSALGYDRDFAALPYDDPAQAVTVRRRANWTTVRLDRQAGIVQVPADLQLDLGATAKAWAADRTAARIHDVIGGSVLVSLGGDIAMAGDRLTDGWPIRVQDRPDGRSDAGQPDNEIQTVAVHCGGLATSSTTARRWRRGGEVMHHLIDPRTGWPAISPWRTVSVAAPSCLAANIASTTAIIRGSDGEKYLRDCGFAARLVDRRSAVTVLNGWPQP